VMHSWWVVSRLEPKNWLTKLLGFDYEIEYMKGKDNLAANAFSRISSTELSVLTLSSISTNIMEEIRQT
jgi:hypothetical protein